MAKYGSASIAVLLVDGYNVLSAKLQGLTWKISSPTQVCHGLGDLWEQTSPTGLLKAELQQTGAYFDDQANGIHAAMSAMPTTTRIVAWAPSGNTIGNAFVGAQGAFTAVYEVLGKVQALVNANVSYIISGQLDRGAIVRDWTAQTANWTGAAVDYTLDQSQRAIPITSASKVAVCVVTTPIPHGLTTGQKVLISGNTLSGPSINADLAVTVLTPTTFSVAVNTSASTGAGTGGSFVLSSTVNGAVGYQLVSDFSGFTGVIGKIQHSADNSSWADLITFTNVTAANAAERLTAAGTVNRYTRSVGTVTGSGSITPFAGIRRS